MRDQPVVELRNAWKAFDRNQVLRGVSLALLKGTTLAVMGGSGVGKTVLLRLCAGLIRPAQEGEPREQDRRGGGRPHRAFMIASHCSPM